MAITKQVDSSSQALARRRQQRKVATIVGLLSPSVLLMTLLFLLSLAFLFSNSAYHFTGLRIERRITFEAYPAFFTDPYYWRVLGESLRLAAVTTFFAVVIGYPTAYGITRIKNQGITLALYILIFSPLLTSVVIRSFGWLILLGDVGFINFTLQRLDLVAEPIKLIYNFRGVAIALIHVLLPFTIFPIISVLNQIEPALKEAAKDLGANRWDTFWRVTWPLSLPGLISGAQVTFVLAVSAFATPAILGGGRVLVLPNQIYQSIVTLNWPMASVQAIVLLVVSLTIVFISNRLFRLVYRAPQETAT